MPTTLISHFTKSRHTRNLKKRERLEREYTAKMAVILASIPRKLIPNAAAAETAQNRLRDHLEPLKDTMVDMMLRAAGQGIEDARDTVEAEVFGIKRELAIDWNLANERARRWALAHAGQLISDIEETTRRAIQEDIAQWIQNGEPLGALINRLQSDYSFSRSRADAIASTEVTRSYAYANREAYRESRVIEGLQWVTANDEIVCPICAPLGGLAFSTEGAIPTSIEQQENRGVRSSLDGGFEHPGGPAQAGKFRGRVFELPPAHPRCRCSISPVILLDEERPSVPVDSGPQPDIVPGERIVEWSPTMSREDAEIWARDSQYKEDVYHVTDPRNHESIKTIKQYGFRLDNVKFGRMWGNGVYVGTDKFTARLYEDWLDSHLESEGLFAAGSSAKLTIKINPKNLYRYVVDVDKWYDPITRQRIDSDLIQADIIMNLTGARDKGEAWDARNDAARAVLGDRYDDTEYFERIALGFTELIKNAGYDGFWLDDPWAEITYGGNQIVLFDPKDVVIIND